MRAFSLSRASALSALLLPKPLTPLPFSTTTVPTTSPPPPPLKDSAKVTSDELSQISRILPRLCGADRLSDAVRLVDACLLAETPLQSFSLSVLISRLCSDPNPAHALDLLGTVERNPRVPPSLLLTICSMVLTTYFKKRRPREAMAVFRWMERTGSACPPDPEVYRIVIVGLCRVGKTFEALKVLKDALGGKSGVVVPGAEVRAWMYRSLLREARIREALEVEKALRGLAEGSDGAEKTAAELLERMVAEWEE